VCTNGTAVLATDMLPFRVINEDDKPFDFTAALHSYFEVLNAEKASVNGLKGLTYLDKSVNPKQPATKVEDREKVTFGSALVDSVYANAPDYVEVDVATGALLSGLRDLAGASTTTPVAIPLVLLK
jgi:glucose-6-phosphate 1-epimerase